MLCLRGLLCLHLCESRLTLILIGRNHIVLCRLSRLTFERHIIITDDLAELFHLLLVLLLVLSHVLSTPSDFIDIGLKDDTVFPPVFSLSWLRLLLATSDQHCLRILLSEL